MLPGSDSNRLMLQQHLLQRRLAQQLAAANVRQLQNPSTASSTAASTGNAPFSSICSAAVAVAAAVGLNRDTSFRNSPRPSPHTQQSELLQRLVAVDQERNRLKRRLSEMQQLQSHRQPLHQQQQQQHVLLQATRGRLERPNNTAKRDISTLFSSFLPTSSHQQQQHHHHHHPKSELIASIQQKAAAMSLPFAVSADTEDDVPDDESRQSAAKEEFKEREQSGDRDDGEEQGREPAEIVIEKPAAVFIGSGVSRKDARWKEMYEELKEYKKKTGSCTVPRGYPENPRLASWVAEQRKQYKLMKDGRQSSITPERVALLQQVDFAWNAQEAAWEKHMRDLKEFRAEHGHCHVPLGDPKFPKLGLWVKEQRRHYTLMKQGKQSHMTEGRCQELDSVDFCWDTHEATWLERLNELRAYKEIHGNCIVPTNYPENPKLGTWIHHQRRQYKKYKEGKPCHITSERIKALDSLGFVWYPRDKSSLQAEARDAGPETATDLTNLDLRPRKRQRT